VVQIAAEERSKCLDHKQRRPAVGTESWFVERQQLWWLWNEVASPLSAGVELDEVGQIRWTPLVKNLMHQ